MRSIIILTATLLFCSCSGAGSGPPVDKLDQVLLHDVQGLWGGMNLWISSDGKATCSFVEPPDSQAKGATGFRESRHEVVLTQAQLAVLLGLVNKHQFFSIKTVDRPGVPDEARPIIYIKSGARTHAVAKWAGDTHENFDPIYDFLKRTVASSKSTEAVYRGEYTEWSPKGFPEARGLVKKTLPELD